MNLHSKKALENINLHRDEDDGMGLSMQQTRIIAGAFELNESRVRNILTKMEYTFYLSIDSVVNETLIK